MIKISDKQLDKICELKQQLKESFNRSEYENLSKEEAFDLVAELIIKANGKTPTPEDINKIVDRLADKLLVYEQTIRDLQDKVIKLLEERKWNVQCPIVMR